MVLADQIIYKIIICGYHLAEHVRHHLPAELPPLKMAFEVTRVPQSNGPVVTSAGVGRERISIFTIFKFAYITAYSKRASNFIIMGIMTLICQKFKYVNILY